MSNTEPYDHSSGYTSAVMSRNTNDAEPSSNVNFKQIFFDCDNTLIDTESSAVEACAEVVNQALADQNIRRRYTIEELLVDHWGKTARQMLAELQNTYGFSLTPIQMRYYARYEADLVVDHILAYPKPFNGIKEILYKLKERGGVRLAVVSSSPLRRIRAALQAAGLEQFFEQDQIFSAKDSMPRPLSKPDPAIYQWAMRYNNVTCKDCIAFEDSRSGAQSAIRAGIPTIAYLGAYSAPAQRRQIALALSDEGCKCIMNDYDGFFTCLEAIWTAKDEPTLADEVR